MNNALTAAGWLAAMLLAAPAVAQTAPPADDLDQRVKVIERKLELQAEDQAARDKATPVVSAGEKGFGLKSADGTYDFKFKGLVQLDGRFFADDKQALNDTFLLRRIEPTFEFFLGKLAFIKIQPQFAGDAAGTADVYGELRFHPSANLRFGKFKTPLGLENLQGAGVLMFVERGYPTEVGAGRDIGVQLGGEVLSGTTTWQVAYLNGAPDGRDAVSSDTDNYKEHAARLFFEPFKNEPGFWRGLGFGVATSAGKKLGTVGITNLANNAASFNNTLPRYRSPGQNTIFSYRLETASAADGVTNTVIADGDHTRVNPQLYFYRGPFGLLAEQMTSKQDVSRNGVADTFEHKAWQVGASWLLTGEDAFYKGIKPNVPYAVGAGGWGAFELALRHGVLDTDDDAFAGGAASFADPAKSVSEARTDALALNWYLTGNARITLDYEKTRFDGGAAGGADRLDEKLLLTRLQVAF
jgi:phosphate-selective porin OprO and OprP